MVHLSLAPFVYTRRKMNHSRRRETDLISGPNHSFPLIYLGMQSRNSFWLNIREKFNAKHFPVYKSCRNKNACSKRIFGYIQLHFSSHWGSEESVVRTLRHKYMLGTILYDFSLLLNPVILCWFHDLTVPTGGRANWASIDVSFLLFEDHCLSAWDNNRKTVPFKEK